MISTSATESQLSYTAALAGWNVHGGSEEKGEVHTNIRRPFDAMTDNMCNGWLCAVAYRIASKSVEHEFTTDYYMQMGLDFYVHKRDEIASWKIVANITRGSFDIPYFLTHLVYIATY